MRTRLKLPPPQLTGASAWPDLALVFQAANDLAWGIAAGLLTLETVERSLLSTPAVQQAWERRHPEASFWAGYNTLRADLIWAIRTAVRDFEERRARAEIAVAKEIAPLLERGGSARSDVLTAAFRACDGLLTPAEVVGIVDREQAWWLRLHASALRQEAHVA